MVDIDLTGIPLGFRVAGVVSFFWRLTDGVSSFSATPVDLSLVLMVITLELRFFGDVAIGAPQARATTVSVDSSVNSSGRG